MGRDAPITSAGSDSATLPIISTDYLFKQEHVCVSLLDRNHTPIYRNSRQKHCEISILPSTNANLPSMYCY